MATVFSEGFHTAEYLVSEAGGYRSREAATITGADLAAGTVLGKVATGTAAAAAKAGGNTGNGVMGTITVGPAAILGTYTLRIKSAAANAGGFEVIDPQGDVVGTGTVGAAFAGGGLSFTLADGATDFVVGDGFDITVSAKVEKYKALNPAATDGSQRAAAVLYEGAPAAAADVLRTITARDAEVNGLALTWPAGITGAQKAVAIADLAALGIIVRS